MLLVCNITVTEELNDNERKIPEGKARGYLFGYLFGIWYWYRKAICLVYSNESFGLQIRINIGVKMMKL